MKIGILVLLCLILAIVIQKFFISKKNYDSKTIGQTEVYSTLKNDFSVGNLGDNARILLPFKSQLKDRKTFVSKGSEYVTYSGDYFGVYIPYFLNLQYHLKNDIVDIKK